MFVEVKKKMIHMYICTCNGQSAAKGPGNRVKVQRLDEVSYIGLHLHGKTSTSARAIFHKREIVRYSPTFYESRRSIG